VFITGEGAMKRLSRTWKFYVIFTTVFVVMVTIVGFALQMQLKNKLQAGLEEQLFTLAKVLARVLPDTADPSELIQWCREYQEATGVRITIIERDGRVVGDSSDDAIVGENRLDRPEITRAIAEGSATAIRYSETLRADMFYAAVFFKEKDKVIRLALPMAEVKAIENEVMFFFALALYLIPFLAIMTSFLFTRYVTSEGPGTERYSRPSHEMTRSDG
jgi:two-component system, OmpR family, phosphate regulon sensor histidine kinase PhoR